MPTTALEILDTAVKIGLGAVISGVATYLVTRRSHKHELRKLQVQETTHLLRECVSKLEHSMSLTNDINNRVFEHWVAAKAAGQNPKLHSFRPEYAQAFNEAKDARSLCVLLGLGLAVDHISAYTDAINDLAQHHTTAHSPSSWVDENTALRSELKSLALKELADAYAKAYA